MQCIKMKIEEEIECVILLANGRGFALLADHGMDGCSYNAVINYTGKSEGDGVALEPMLSSNV